jgi:riboflavin-specific deaminase-like protein
MSAVHRPHVTVVMAMTADGKISTAARESVRLAGPHDRELLDRLRAESDVVLHGSGTIRADDPPMRIRSEARVRERAAAGLPPHPLQVVVSGTLDLPFGGRFFNEPGVPRLVVTGSDAPAERVREAEGHAEVVRLARKDVAPEDLLALLAGRGLRRALLEGGGAFNFAFFAIGAVDEVYLTIAPWVLGGSRAPTPVDGDGFTWRDRVPLELVSFEVESGEIYARYRVRRGST